MRETPIREVWQSVTVHPALAGLAQRLVRSVVGAPLGWLLLAPLYAGRLLGFLPGLARLTVRYSLTNHRLVVRHGMRPRPAADVPLDQIADVRLVPDAAGDFFQTATLEVLAADGRVLLTLPAVPEPESFRRSIVQTAAAWGPILISSP